MTTFGWKTKTLPSPYRGHSTTKPTNQSSSSISRHPEVCTPTTHGRGWPLTHLFCMKATEEHTIISSSKCLQQKLQVPSWTAGDAHYQPHLHSESFVCITKLCWSGQPATPLVQLRIFWSYVRLGLEVYCWSSTWKGGLPALHACFHCTWSVPDGEHPFYLCLSETLFLHDGLLSIFFPAFDVK